MSKYHNNQERPDYTPLRIDTLKADEVFVFGSNLQGNHAGGAARAAVNNFGAIWGQGEGLQGQSYAIPTMQGGVETIMPYVRSFLWFASQHEELFFYVTPIGCGIAGFKAEEIAPLFRGAIQMKNVCLPEEFVKIIRKNRQCGYSAFQMVVDMAKELNNSMHFKNSGDIEFTLDKVAGSYNQRMLWIERLRWFFDERILNYREGVNMSVKEKEYDSFIKEIKSGIMPLQLNVHPIIWKRWSSRIAYVLERLQNEMPESDDTNTESRANRIRYAFASILTGRQSCGMMDYFHDDLEFPVMTLAHIVEDEWENLNTDGILDNEKLDIYVNWNKSIQNMCADHESDQLDSVIDNFVYRL